MAEAPNKMTMKSITTSPRQGEFDELIELVHNWAEERNLLSRDNVKSQMLKVVEEIGETARAVNKGDILETVDGIGDSFVTLIILAFQLGLSPAQCLNDAYEVIKSRTGKTVNGTFIKD
jgi:NTP pyrophosphatase (non-canonical NTP hydrolase)